MSWSLFFATVAILYALYYGVVIGMDFLKSGDQQGEYKEETEEVGLTDLTDDEEDEATVHVDAEEEEDSSLDQKRNPTPKKEEAPNLPKEKKNINYDLLTQGLSMDKFSKEAQEITKSFKMG